MGEEHTVSIGKIRQFIAATVALVAGICVIAIVAAVMGYDIPVLGMIPKAIGITPGGN